MSDRAARARSRLDRGRRRSGRAASPASGRGVVGSAAVAGSASVAGSVARQRQRGGRRQRRRRRSAPASSARRASLAGLGNVGCARLRRLHRLRRTAPAASAASAASRLTRRPSGRDRRARVDRVRATAVTERARRARDRRSARRHDRGPSAAFTSVRRVPRASSAAAARRAPDDRAEQARAVRPVALRLAHAHRASARPSRAPRGAGGPRAAAACAHALPVVERFARLRRSADIGRSGYSPSDAATYDIAAGEHDDADPPALAAQQQPDRERSARRRSAPSRSRRTTSLRSALTPSPPCRTCSVRDSQQRRRDVDAAPRSPPGHSASEPLAEEERAERRQQQPDRVLQVRLRQPRQRPVHDVPIASTISTATPARRAPAPSPPAVERGDDQHDARALRSATPLNATTRAGQSARPGRRGGSASIASRASRYSCSESDGARRPASRSTPVRSHSRPNSRSATPTTSAAARAAAPPAAPGRPARATTASTDDRGAPRPITASRRGRETPDRRARSPVASQQLRARRLALRPRLSGRHAVTASYPARPHGHETGTTSSCSTTAPPAPTPAEPEREEQPPRLLPPPAREHAQDARGARRRGPGHAVRGRPRRGDLGAARGGADLRRRRRALPRPTSSARSRRRPPRARSRAARRCRTASSSCSPGSRGTGDDHIDVRHDPTVILVVGVNGTGKTTTIAKLARRLENEGKSVVLGAADTFRAAATSSSICGPIASACRREGHEGSDPAAVAFTMPAAASAVPTWSSSTPPAACTPSRP